MTDNDSRHIVLTGASRGLGRALVDQFVARGHRLSACARNAAAMQELAAQFPATHRFDTVDIADIDAVKQWSKDVMAHQGSADLLINNASVINENAPLWKVEPEQFNRLIDINIGGVFNTIHQFLPAMLESKKGVVVNLSSGWGRSVSAEVAPYCASKWAIEGLTRALAAELPDGMAAVPLNPGIINTDMLQSCFGSAASDYADATSWAEIAAPFLLNISAEDNGQSLTVPD